MKRCPFCAEKIQNEAIICRYCGNNIVSTIPSQKEVIYNRTNITRLIYILIPLSIILIIIFGYSIIKLPLSSSPEITSLPTHLGIKMGQIVFMSLRVGDKSYQIYTMEADGTNISRLTTANENTDPRWSPDGSKIVFVSWIEGNGDIYVMDKNGKNITRLTTNPEVDFHPVWSPDGTHIAFISDRGGSRGIYVMDNNGSNITLLNSANMLGNLDWSPDGLRIVFSAGGLYIMNADGSNLTQLIGHPEDDYEKPTFSPDGLRLTFISRKDDPDPANCWKTQPPICNYEIYVLSVNDLNITRLTSNPLYDSDPTWSPDGSKIAFASNQNGKGGIYIMNSDGSDLIRITDEFADQSPDWSQ